MGCKDKYVTLTQASYESLPAPFGHTDSHTLKTYIWGGGARGALILDRCRAFDLFASVDAHLWFYPTWLEPYCFVIINSSSNVKLHCFMKYPLIAKIKTYRHKSDFVQTFICIHVYKYEQCGTLITHKFCFSVGSEVDCPKEALEQLQ
jgi:hypothetical protein